MSCQSRRVERYCSSVIRCYAGVPRLEEFHVAANFPAVWWWSKPEREGQNGALFFLAGWFRSTWENIPVDTLKSRQYSKPQLLGKETMLFFLLGRYITIGSVQKGSWRYAEIVQRNCHCWKCRCILLFDVHVLSRRRSRARLSYCRSVLFASCRS